MLGFTIANNNLKKNDILDSIPIKGNKCLARVWGKGDYGKTQCSNIITKQYDYIKNMRLQLKGVMILFLEKTKNELSKIEATVKTISPISTLDRGYAIVSDSKTNKIVKNANHLKVGKKIHVKLATSEIDSTVDKIYEK